MLTSQDYQSAILVQDACNLSGIVHSWHELVTKIWEEANAQSKGTDWVNAHPINVLFASKVASLTGCEVGASFSYAYEICKERANDPA